MIARIYGDDAVGLRDSERIPDVGWRLWSRCGSVLLASDSCAECPRCRARVEVRWMGQPLDRPSACPGCGWTVTAGDYHASLEHQDLLGTNARRAFATYVHEYPLRHDPVSQLLTIDRLVHAAHVSGNTAARNLFEGRRPRQLVRVLDELTASSGGSSVLMREGPRRR